MRTVTFCAGVVIALAAAACGGSSTNSATRSPAPPVERTATVAPTPAAPVSATATAPANTATAAACPTRPATTPVASLSYSATGPTAPPTSLLTSVTTQTTACTDRITFGFAPASQLPGYRAMYVQSPTQCGSGAPVTTQGQAQIEIKFSATDAHDQQGNPTAPGIVTVGGTSLREAVRSCDFEADVTYVLGTAQRYFTVTTQASPPSVIVEIDH